jgi:hypothetical protein
LRLAQRCTRPRQVRVRRQEALPHSRHRQSRSARRRSVSTSLALLASPPALSQLPLTFPAMRLAQERRSKRRLRDRGGKPTPTRGWRAEERKPLAPHPLPTRRTPFGAPEADDYSAPGRAFAVCAPRPAELSSRGDGRVWDRPLAGPRSGHGRSPDAARVARQANEPRRRGTPSR